MNMTNVIAKSTELDNDLVKVHRELKRIASVKCRLKKLSNARDYEEKMTRVLQEEQLLKNVRDYLNGPRKNINTVTQEEIDNMDYDEVCRALNAIRSKKTHTLWAADCEKGEDGLYIPGSGASYKEACRIEEMLKVRRNDVKPIENNAIRKTDLQAMLDTLKVCSDLDVTTCIARIEQFMKGCEK